ncbi:SRPBCC family protein [Archangium gephyra]|uniref:SRPBCC family protein n=1 Tax=Archangium gephyra TaxID=48 RepID=UPI003B7D078D
MRSVAGVVVLVCTLVAGGAGAEDWEQVSDGDIAIKARPYTAVTGGREVWAEGVLPVSLQDVQAALTDHDNFRNFMPYVTESRLLSRGEDGTRLTYTRLDFPLISDRDYVLRVHDEPVLGADGTQVAFHQKWTPDNSALPERVGVVRLRHNQGSWYFTPRAEGGVRFVYRFIVEPGGSIPGFLAGVGQKDAVLATVRGVEKRALKLAADRAPTK